MLFFKYFDLIKELSVILSFASSVVLVIEVKNALVMEIRIIHIIFIGKR